MSYGDPPFMAALGTCTMNNTVPIGGYVAVDPLALQNIQDLQQLGQLNGLQTAAINTSPLLNTQIGQAPPFQYTPINQYRSQVERLLPLNPKSGQTVSLWFDGQQWVKLADRPFVYREPPEAGSEFSLEELSEASDMINEIESEQDSLSKNGCGA